jgi:hypothetical protein
MPHVFQLLGFISCVLCAALVWPFGNEDVAGVDVVCA